MGSSIGILTTEYQPVVGGIATFSSSMLRILKQGAADAYVITTVPSGSASPLTDEVFRTSRLLQLRFLKLLPLFVLAFLTAIRRRTELHVAMVWTHEGLVAYLLKRILRVRYIVFANGSEVLTLRHSRIRALLARLVFSNADYVIAISNYTKELLVNQVRLPADRVRLFNPPVTLDEVEAPSSSEEVSRRFRMKGKRVLLTAARHVPRKGHELVIRSLSALRSRYPDLLYVMTGGGPHTGYLKDLADRLEVADIVRMVGFVTAADLRALYHLSELYVSPSINCEGDVEGFGLAFAEAGAASIPVIAGDSGGVRDVILDKVTGLLVEPGNLASLVAAITVLLDDAPLRGRMGQAARQHVSKMMDLPRKSAEFLAIIAKTPASR